MKYKCKSPVVVIIFNRPNYTKKLFEIIKNIEPPKLYIISDGARENNQNENTNVKECRKIFENITWDCSIERVYSKNNLGCKKRVITGLNFVFSKEEQAIILEDDCIPIEEFFEFCDWGLTKYKNNKNIGIISGSNLLDYTDNNMLKNDEKAGFSKFINCWGWATWKETWDEFDLFLSIQEINEKERKLFKEYSLNKFQKKFWIEIFKHSVASKTIWDFYLQYTFFDKKLLSVYPKNNLVENIGFGEDSTHTKKTMDFVTKSKPKFDEVIKMKKLKDPIKIKINECRDENVIRVIYGYSILATVKIIIGNIIRYNNWKKK